MRGVHHPPLLLLHLHPRHSDTFPILRDVKPHDSSTTVCCYVSPFLLSHSSLPSSVFLPLVVSSTMWIIAAFPEWFSCVTSIPTLIFAYSPAAPRPCTSVYCLHCNVCDAVLLHSSRHWNQLSLPFQCPLGRACLSVWAFALVPRGLYFSRLSGINFLTAIVFSSWLILPNLFSYVLASLMNVLKMSLNLSTSFALSCRFCCWIRAAYADLLSEVFL